MKVKTCLHSLWQTIQTYLILGKYPTKLYDRGKGEYTGIYCSIISLILIFVAIFGIGKAVQELLSYDHIILQTKPLVITNDENLINATLSSAPSFILVENIKFKVSTLDKNATLICSHFKVISFY